MTHSPENDAALYLIGELHGKTRTAFEGHLLECEHCWQEVTLAREGRALAETAREAAPSELRERIRATIAAHPPEISRKAARRHWLPALSIGLSAAAAIAIGVIAIPQHSTGGEPGVITAALSDYSHDRLPGTGMVHEIIPNLTSLGLNPVGTGHGLLAKMAVNAFAYRNASGQRLVIYTSEVEFPRAEQATNLSSSIGPWIAHNGTIAMVCARAGHSMLIIGSDDTLLEKVGSSLGAM